jgi:hypothetical protein
MKQILLTFNQWLERKLTGTNACNRVYYVQLYKDTSNDTYFLSSLYTTEEEAENMGVSGETLEYITTLHTNTNKESITLI